MALDWFSFVCPIEAKYFLCRGTFNTKFQLKVDSSVWEPPAAFAACKLSGTLIASYTQCDRAWVCC